MQRMMCPKDKVAAEEKYLGEVQVDVCSVCHGVWLEKEEVRKLTRDLTRPTLNEVDDIIDTWEKVGDGETVPADFWQEEKLSCPKDGTRMRKHFFAGSKIGVDQCPTCQAFWLDGGELQAVAELMKPDFDADRAAQLFIRDNNDWHKKLREIQSLPATVVSVVATPVYGVFLVGNFITQTLLDWVDLAANREERNQR
jgi:Zn-finger nucleic acid-binding protein